MTEAVTWPFPPDGREHGHLPPPCGLREYRVWRADQG